MQIAMLGPLDVRTDAGGPSPVSGIRLARLLIVLALHPRRVVSTATIVDAVWGDAPPDEPANAVQALVSRVRRAVPGIEVASRAQGYLLDIEPDAVDVVRFERLAGHGSTPEMLREALGLWRGTALADAGDAEFATPVRARLDELRLAALQRRIEADLETGPAGPVVAELEGLVATYPLREPLVRLLMRALSATGDRGRALAVYDEARKRFAEELGIAPSAGLAAEHLAVLRADADPHPDPDHPLILELVARNAVETTTNSRINREVGGRREGDRAGLTNLRAELSSFVGRDADVAVVAAKLSEHRLTTLIGPGGAGKTRLAARTAREHLTSSPGGVWMVEFAPVTDPGDVVTTVLSAMGVRDRALVRNAGGSVTVDLADPHERLIASLAHRRALLVFDNCEHLIDATAALAADILGACAGVRIIATSREPLNVAGEVLWPVEPLELPPATKSPHGPQEPPAAPRPPDNQELPADERVEQLTAYPSIRLFAQRAAAVRPGFAVTSANAEAVVRICRALDGMPLAIELAAARMRAMTPEQFADRLDDRFAMLNGGNRTALPRHQTLRAVVDWSWDLLDQPERLAWRRLALFTGGATLAAAEAVCGPSALDAITALVDKSLLSVRDDEPEPRYTMLETIRAYGLMRLDESGERLPTRAAHAAHFRNAAEVASKGLLGAQQMEWLARLRADHDNLTTAIRNAVADGDAMTAIRLVGAVAWYWWISGHRRDGTELLSDVFALVRNDGFETAPDLDLADPAVRSDLEARAMAYTMGALLAIDGDHQTEMALEWFDRGVAIVTRIGSPDEPMLRMVGPLRLIFQTFESGTLPLTLDLGMPVDDPDPWISAMARVIRAHVMLNLGRMHDEAEADFRFALAIFQRLGEAWGTSFALLSLSTIEAWRGEIPEAIADIDAAMLASARLGMWEDRVGFRAQLVRLLWITGDRTRARAELALAESDAVRVGVPEVLGSVAQTAADIARFDGDLVTADIEVRRAERLVADHTISPQSRALLVSARAFIASARGDIDEARRLHQEAVAIAVSSIDAPIIAQTLVGLADVALAVGDARLAATVLGASTAIRGLPDLSLVDARRVMDEARSALGPPAFEAAYSHGVSATVAQIGDLVGVPMPALATRPDHSSSYPATNGA